MILAVKTTASPAEIWAIVVVAVICLATWLFMVTVVAPRPSALARRMRAAKALEPGSQQADAATAQAQLAAAQAAQAQPSWHPGPASQPAMAPAGAHRETAVTRDDMPAVAGAATPAATGDDRPRVPGPRTSAADRAPAGAPGTRRPDDRRAATAGAPSPAGPASSAADDPGVQWTAPRPRETPTDQAAHAAPRRGWRRILPRQHG
jgi:hypothetical protein